MDTIHPFDPSVLPVVHLPELFDTIQVYLTSNSDLVTLTQVCKEFARLFNPLVWHTIEIKIKRQHERFVNTPEVKEAIRRHGREYIRVIRIKTRKSLAPFFMEVDPYLDPYNDTHQDDDATLLLNLHTLEFPWPRRLAFEDRISSTTIQHLSKLFGPHSSESITNDKDDLESFYLEQSHFHRARAKWLLTVDPW